jgi:Ribosomal RNA methyltransferase (FmrO)
VAEDTQPGDLLTELAADLAGQVARRYRVGRAEATWMIVEDWRRQPGLIAAIAAAGSAEQARRLKVYRDAATAAKRGIYSRLRRYWPTPACFTDALATLATLAPGADPSGPDEALLTLAAAHVSTAERLPHREEFLALLTARMGGGQIVVDVGSGVFPLIFPAGWLGRAGVRQYWALDKDPHAQAALGECVRLRADPELRPLTWNFAAGWEPLHAAGLPRRCDVGLLLKVVPVVARQSPALLTVLAATPADRLLISCSRVAMAKRLDIERRELRTITAFCRSFGFTKCDEFRTADEVCVVVTRHPRTEETWQSTV